MNRKSFNNQIKIFWRSPDESEWHEIKDLYWFEENGVRDFDGEGHHYERYLFKFEDNGRVVFETLEG